MAAGTGGFSTSPMGFNKNEVNEYIASISKRLSEIEAEKKEIEKKYESVKKVVDGADDKAKQVENAARERIEKLEEQLRNERKNSEDLINQIDDLKRKLKNAVSAVSAASKAAPAGQVNTAAAEKRSAEIIAAAEKTAKETVAKANRTAEDIVAKAKKAAAQMPAKTVSVPAKVDMSGFMAQLKSFSESMNSGCKALLAKAEEISDKNGAAAESYDEMPDLSSFAGTVADEPETNAFDSGADFVNTVDDGDMGGGMDEINALLDSMSGGNDSSDDMDAGFGFGSVDSSIDEDKNDDLDMGGDMSFDDIDGGISENEADVPEDDGMDGAFDLGLGLDITDDTQSDGEEIGELTADFADTVEAGDAREEDNLQFGMGNEMDEMQKLLEQAELTFGGGASEFEEKTADASEALADDWSSLQNELDALEKTGGDTVDDMDSGSSNGAPANDIWSLGDVDMSGSDDDDMSGDLFGSF